MPIADVNGVQLHFERSGAGEPLLLVHGSWVDSRVWDGVVPLLSRAFEVVVYDRRGHSLSSCPPGQGSVHDDVDDLAALIDFLALGPAHVAGASWGGSIALRLAAARPGLLRTVAAHEPPLFDLLDGEAPDPPELAELRARLATVAALLEAGDLEGAARLYFDQVAETPGGWAGLDDGQRSMLLANALTYLDQSGDPDALGIEVDELAAFGGPALVTYGDRRPPFFKQIVETVVAAMPGARSEVLPGTAHDPQVTDPGAYARAIEGLTGRRRAGSGPSGARKEQVLELFAGLPRRYDAAGTVLSFAQDPRWRRAMVARVGAAPQDRVLDVATGTGMVAAALVRRYGCRVVGLDQSSEMLSGAEARLRASPDLASRTELVRGEAESLPFADGEFDHLTFTYLLRYVDDPAATLRELARVVKPGGRMASLEFMLPPNPVARALWSLYVRFGLPVLGRLISRDWHQVGRFLGPSITGFYRRLPLQRQLELWREAGFVSVGARVMSLGGGVVIWGTRDG